MTLLSYDQNNNGYFSRGNSYIKERKKSLTAEPRQEQKQIAIYPIITPRNYKTKLNTTPSVS